MQISAFSFSTSLDNIYRDYSNIYLSRGMLFFLFALAMRETFFSYFSFFFFGKVCCGNGKENCHNENKIEGKQLHNGLGREE